MRLTVTAGQTRPFFMRALYFADELLHRSIEITWQTAVNDLKLLFMWPAPCGSQPEKPATGEGGNVELKMRLNVAAAIMSFAFLAAIVFGMI